VQDQITARLDELKQEYSRGQTRLQELDIQQAALRETMLRISGAIQVLEEMLEQQSAAGGEDAGSDS
jgi:predicted nuclease with TOPRIM domain